MRFLYHPDRKDMTLAGVLYALGDPVRLEIVRLLATKGEQCCAGFDFAIAKSTMSNHFKILRESGVVLTRKEGTQHINILRRDDLETLFPGLLNAVLLAAQPLDICAVPKEAIAILPKGVVNANAIIKCKDAISRVFTFCFDSLMFY